MSPSRFVLLALLVATYACATGADGNLPPVPGTATEPPPEDQSPIPPAQPQPGGPKTVDPSTFPLPTDGSNPKLRRAQTEHLGQLTNTPSNPAWNNGITGTDLGVTFERDGKLVYLFGDSWTPGGARQDQDSMAWSTDTALPQVGSLPKLSWLTDSHNQFVSPRLPGIDLGSMNVPVEGIPVGDKTLVFFSSGWNPSTQQHSNSVLATMNGTDLSSLTLTHNVASKKFINLSAVVEGTTAYIYGSGKYRASPVYLAKVDVSDIANREKWQYMGASGSFSGSEDAAQPVASTACVGELSVRKWDKAGLYFMTYNCATPGGIQIRWSRSASGPWSDPINIFDNDKDGFQHFIHANESSVGHDDGLSEPGRYDEQGGSYGAYLIPRYFALEEGNVISLVYVLSSWNPYQAHLMRTRLVLDSDSAFTPSIAGANMPAPRLANGDFTQQSDFSHGIVGWEGSGALDSFMGSDNKPRLTTYTGQGDANTVKVWQDITIDAKTSELRFKVHGGDARIVLLRGEEVVRSTTGRRTNSPETQVIWNLTEFRGETVRLMVDDSLTSAWGFIGLSGFELR